MPQALHELRAAKAYIAEFNPSAAERIAQRLLAAGDSLAELPERGRSLAGGLRELVAAPPYLIRYRNTAGGVEILTVRHAARRRS